MDEDDIRGYRFGGLGAGRILGSLGPYERPRLDRYQGVMTMMPGAERPRALREVVTTETADKITEQTVNLLGQGKQPVVVEYKTPKERANQSAWRNVRAGAVALIVAIVPLLITFLTVGDFGREALIALATGVGIAALMTILDWAQKHNEARIDDAARDRV